MILPAEPSGTVLPSCVAFLAALPAKKLPSDFGSDKQNMPAAVQGIMVCERFMYKSDVPHDCVHNPTSMNFKGNTNEWFAMAKYTNPEAKRQ